MLRQKWQGDRSHMALLKGYHLRDGCCRASHWVFCNTTCLKQVNITRIKLHCEFKFCTWKFSLWPVKDLFFFQRGRTRVAFCSTLACFAMKGNEQSQVCSHQSSDFLRSYLMIFDDFKLVGWGRGGQGNKVRTLKKDQKLNSADNFF